MTDPAAVVNLIRGTLATALLLAAPLLGVALLAGLLTSLAQAVTSMQDYTINFVPKVLGVLAVLAAASPWMLGRLMGYTRELLAHLEHPGAMRTPMTFSSPALVPLLAVLVRTGALLGTAPLLDTLALGPRLKAALALVVALLVAPTMTIPGTNGPLDPFGLGALLLREAAVGAAIGLAARLLLTSMELAGTLLGYQTGFSYPPRSTPPVPWPPT